MEPVILVDGQNLKGKISAVFRNAGKGRPVWHEYDFKRLFDTVLPEFDGARRIFYFAKIKEHEESIEKSRELIEEQRLLKRHLEAQGFEVVLSGRVRGQYDETPTGKKVLVFREKGVDVKLGVDMVALACDRKVSQIILASSDSDLQPAIHEVRARNVECIYLGFEMQPNRGMTYTTNRTILFRNAEVLLCETIQPQLLGA